MLIFLLIIFIEFPVATSSSLSFFKDNDNVLQCLFETPDVQDLLAPTHVK